jgi:hypothetical protein
VYASSWSLTGKTKPSEFPLWGGGGDLAFPLVNGKPAQGPWGSYTGMTVDPVDGCTFWFASEYLATTQNGTNGLYDWNTRISNFKLPTCH